MIVKNTSDKDIGWVSFEGFEFLIPRGVSMIWSPPAEYLLKRIFKVETAEEGQGGIPPLMRAEEDDWEGMYAQVRRFQIRADLIPNRNDLIRIAEQRGVSKDIIEKFRFENIENQDIVRAINDLPIPEEILMPKE